MAAVDPAPEIPRLAEHLFRHEAGKIVSALTGIFGIHRLQLAEDVVQEALIRALSTWPYHGIPGNPAAWLMRTAKNRALDVIRREKFFHDKLPEITASLEALENQPEAPASGDEIRDDRLRLIFACCHPLLPVEDQSALALKTLCGFSVGEIAAAFLTTEAAVAKRLTRAKRKIADLRIPFEIPAGPELEARLDGVLRVIYLLFNEGYKASAGERLLREELCHEAVRLASLLAGHPAGDAPRVHALLALMLLDAARLPARQDDHGNLLRLRDQDRTRWDRSRIAAGLRHLALSASGGELTEYHLQAGISACHSTAADDASTDWPAILGHYDRWLEIGGGPVVALNRAVALAKVRGPETALEAVDELRRRGQLETYYLLHAVLGDLEEQLGRLPAAALHFERALGLAGVPSERNFLNDRLKACAIEPNPPTRLHSRISS